MCDVNTHSLFLSLSSGRIILVFHTGMQFLFFIILLSLCVCLAACWVSVRVLAILGSGFTKYTLSLKFGEIIFYVHVIRFVWSTWDVIRMSDGVCYRCNEPGTFFVSVRVRGFYIRRKFIKYFFSVLYILRRLAKGKIKGI